MDVRKCKLLAVISGKIVYFVGMILWLYNEIARWPDFRVKFLLRASTIGCFSEVAAFQRLGIAKFQEYMNIR